MDEVRLSDIPSRLAARVLPEPNSGCWIWTGRAEKGSGYGRCKWRSSETGGLSHRLIWLVLVGPLGKSDNLHHRCLSPFCVNPRHLEVLTRSEHQRIHRPRFCKNGHDLTLTENRHRTRRGCRACTNIKQRSQRTREYKRLYAKKRRTHDRTRSIAQA
jgi:hypothetical protein